MSQGVQFIKPLLHKRYDPRLRIKLQNLEFPGDVCKTQTKIYQVRDEVMKMIAMALSTFSFTRSLLTLKRRENEGVNSLDLQQFHIYHSGELSERLSFSFSGCSWLVFYEIGVAKALTECVSPSVLKDCAFVGASTGSLVAVALALEIDIDFLEATMIKSISSMAKDFLGPFGRMDSLWREILEKMIPEEFDHLLAERLFLSLSEFPSSKVMFRSGFKDKQILIDHILSCCYVPGFYSTPITIGNKIYLGTVPSIPVLENINTITVSPHPKHANICPQLVRYMGIQEIFPPSEVKVCMDMIEDGFKDCKRWLQRSHHAHILPNKFFQPEYQTKAHIKLRI